MNSYARTEYVCRKAPGTNLCTNHCCSSRSFSWLPLPRGSLGCDGGSHEESGSDEEGQSHEVGHESAGHEEGSDEESHEEGEEGECDREGFAGEGLGVCGAQREDIERFDEGGPGEEQGWQDRVQEEVCEREEGVRQQPDQGLGAGRQESAAGAASEGLLRRGWQVRGGKGLVRQGQVAPGVIGDRQATCGRRDVGGPRCERGVRRGESQVAVYIAGALLEMRCIQV